MMQIKQQTQSIIITMSLTLTTAASANTVEQAFTTGHQGHIPQLADTMN
ncbi:hypothetical protein [Acinetobacter sp. TUM15131]|nr:hypothetical protein [Acinetobacter sp. TUM15131]